jgi:hypothetical protein
MYISGLQLHLDFEYSEFQVEKIDILTKIMEQLMAITYTFY